MYRNTFVVALLALLGAGVPARAGILVGGNASSQATADTIVDIVFAIDTSGSMLDDIAAIANVAKSAIENLDCPNKVYIRARFMGITGNSGSLFNENVRSYVLGKGGTPLSNNSEDNGPAVIDLINHYEFKNDAVSGQKYVKAVVTIGDEGTENGSPVDQADYTVASQANQLAIAKNTLLFSWITNDPFAGVPKLFEVMAVGGTPASGFTGTFGNTGGRFINDQAGNISAQAALQEVLCTAGQGGTNLVPEPSSMLLCGLGGLVLMGRSAWRSRLVRRASVAA